MSKKADFTESPETPATEPAVDSEAATATEAPAGESTESEATSESPVGGGQSADPITTLTETGTAILAAPSREELAELINTIPADIAYMVGAVAHNIDTGEYTITLTLK